MNLFLLFSANPRVSRARKSLEVSHIRDTQTRPRIFNRFAKSRRSHFSLILMFALNDSWNSSPRVRSRCPITPCEANTVYRVHRYITGSGQDNLPICHCTPPQHCTSMAKINLVKRSWASGILIHLNSPREWLLCTRKKVSFTMTVGYIKVKLTQVVYCK